MDWLIQRDRHHHLKFAPLQGETAQQTLPAEDRQNLSSLIVLSQSRPFRRSTAVIKALTALGGPWRIMALFYLIPTFLRDLAYNLVARNRYRWFGRRQICRLPKPEEKNQLLP